MSSHRDTSINPKGAGDTKAKMPATTPEALSPHSESPPAVPDASKRIASTSPPPAKKLKANTGDEPPHLDYTHVSSTWLDNVFTSQNTADSSSPHLTYHKGDMFADAPRGCVLVHACNTQGHWGAGIAKAFKQRYPKAYADHYNFCARDHSKANPVPTGTAQLLAPRDGDLGHWIGCVFTSAKYGKGKDKPDLILRNTIKSMQMLLELISQVDGEIREIRMCKINSGKFGVPWEKTEEATKSIKLKPQWRKRAEVWEPEE